MISQDTTRLNPEFFRTLSIHGDKMRVYDEGAPDQPALLLLHGTPHSAEAFRYNVPALRQAGYLPAFHIRTGSAFGKSSSLPRTTAMRTFRTLCVLVIASVFLAIQGFNHRRSVCLSTTLPKWCFQRSTPNWPDRSNSEPTTASDTMVGCKPASNNANPAAKTHVSAWIPQTITCSTDHSLNKLITSFVGWYPCFTNTVFV